MMVDGYRDRENIRPVPFTIRGAKKRIEIASRGTWNRAERIRKPLRGPSPKFVRPRSHPRRSDGPGRSSSRPAARNRPVFAKPCSVICAAQAQVVRLVAKAPKQCPQEIQEGLS